MTLDKLLSRPGATSRAVPGSNLTITTIPGSRPGDSSSSESSLNALVQDAIGRNQEAYRDMADRAPGQAADAASQMNEQVAEGFYNSLDELFPEWRELIVDAGADAQRRSIDLTDAFATNVMPGLMESIDRVSSTAMQDVEARLRGELSPDVEARVRRQAAELGASLGVFGQARSNMVARDLGRTSQDMVDSGHALAPQAAGFAAQAYGQINQVLQMPVATGQQVNKLLEPYRAPQVDTGQVYSQLLAAGSRAMPSVDNIISNIYGQAQHESSMQAERSRIELAQDKFRYQKGWDRENAALQRKALAFQRKAWKNTGNPSGGSSSSSTGPAKWVQKYNATGTGKTSLVPANMYTL